MLPTRTVALVLAPLLLAIVVADADARPRVRPDPVWEREPELIGYRVSVEPVLRYYKCGRGERCPGGDIVATDAVIWKNRSVLRAPNGQEIEARFGERGRDNVVKDREELLQRGFAPNAFSHCRGDLSPGCSHEVLRRGFGPEQLQHCARVDDACALAVLARGHSPNLLSGCRR